MRTRPRESRAPQLHAGVLYVPVSSYEEAMVLSPGYECCTFRGSLLALDAATGKTIWKTPTIAEPAQPTTKSKTGKPQHGPSGVPIGSAPTYDERRDVVYVATGNNYSASAPWSSDRNPAWPTRSILTPKALFSGKLAWRRAASSAA